MKFIHFADAHLDSPFRGLSFLPSKAFNQIYKASDISLKRIVDLAIQEKVELVLIAGDTFDSSHPSPRSQLYFADQINRLTTKNIQVVMIFGNHDHMKKDDLLLPTTPYFKLLGNKEKIETASFTTKNGFKYNVVGFSYLNNHIVQDKVSVFPQKTSDYTFGIMHAQVKTTSSNQNNYAPFTIAELEALNYDYFALGHIHLRQTLSQSPWIVYPGNIQGRHINELGAKGCILGQIDEKTKQTKIDFYQTSPVIWKTCTLKIDKLMTKNDLQKQLLDVGPIKQTTYFSLRLAGAEYLTDEEIELIQDNDFWQKISANLPFSSQIVDLRFISNEQLILTNDDQLAFRQAEKELFTDKEFNLLVKKWSSKDDLAEDAIANPQFKQEVKDLAKIKLANKLKGINYETGKN